MSESSPHTTHDLDCPNCGAPYEPPHVGNRAECEFCGSQFIVPASALPNSTALSVGTSDGSSVSTQQHAARWVRIFVIILILGFVVPPVCAFAFSFCMAIVAVIAELVN